MLSVSLTQTYHHFRRNHMHENGVLTKQSSPYFQTVACHNNITNNVMYNGPRAGKSPSPPKCLCTCVSLTEGALLLTGINFVRTSRPASSAFCECCGDFRVFGFRTTASEAVIS